MSTYFDFAVSDLERHQLMDMPMLRDFTPSEEAYRPAVECYEIMRSILAEIGIRRQADLGMYTALTSGLVNQQLANDPQGDRWRVLLPRALTLFADDLGLPGPATHTQEEEMKPRTPALDRRTAMRLAATEYQRCAELLRSLDTQAWAAPTACPAWDVRQMAAHMLGMVEMAASIREGGRQRRAAAVG